jgi:hypothetical protein
MVSGTDGPKQKVNGTPGSPSGEVGSRGMEERKRAEPSRMVLALAINASDVHRCC